MIHRLVHQLAQRLLSRDVTILIKLNGIYHIVICDTALNDIILRLLATTPATINNIIQPLKIIRRKDLIAGSRQGLCKIDVEFVGIERWNGATMTFGNYTRPIRRLFAKSRQIEALTKVNGVSASLDIRGKYINIRTMEKDHFPHSQFRRASTVLSATYSKL